MPLCWNPQRAQADKPDMAEVSLISPLGLCVPTQGKSRVGFLRQMGAASMAARVTALAYPLPSQLALYAVAPGGPRQDFFRHCHAHNAQDHSFRRAPAAPCRAPGADVEFKILQQPAPKGKTPSARQKKSKTQGAIFCLAAMAH